MPELPKTKIIFNNQKIKCSEKYFPGKNDSVEKKFQVQVKGSVSSKLGKIKHTEILDEKHFWEWMEDYLSGVY